jgi:hypothetical protein
VIKSILLEGNYSDIETSPTSLIFVLIVSERNETLCLSISSLHEFFLANNYRWRVEELDSNLQIELNKCFSISASVSFIPLHALHNCEFYRPCGPIRPSNFPINFCDVRLG